jgi:hypothetical protein
MIDEDTEFHLSYSRVLIRASHARLRRYGDGDKRTKESIFATLKLIERSRQKVDTPYFQLMS